MRKHAAASAAASRVGDMDRLVLARAGQEWERGIETGCRTGWRNAQVSMLAPTGTISLMMDCQTMGIEPDFALVKSKKLTGGGSMRLVNDAVPRALRYLGYQREQIEAIMEHIREHGYVVRAPGLRKEHHEVFDCAMGERRISPMGHLKMMAAVQPFLSGAISKTVNLPQLATIDDVENIYLQSWRLGLKAVAVFRDRCKVDQVLTAPIPL